MKLLSFSDLKREKGHPFCQKQTMRMVDEKRFPAPIKPGSGPNARMFWVDEEVDAHYAALIANRGKDAA